MFKRYLIGLFVVLMIGLALRVVEAQIVNNGSSSSSGGGGSFPSCTMGQLLVYAVTGSTPSCATVTGDSSSTYSAGDLSVLNTGINGATVPASAALTATNSSSQLTAVTVGNGLTKSGSSLAVTTAVGYVFPSIAATATEFANGSANGSEIWDGEWLAAPVTWSHICINISTDDASNKYDVAIYNSSGTLLADIGAQSFSSTGYQCFGIIQNSSCTGSGAPSTCCTGSATGTCPVSVTTSGLIFFETTGNSTTAQFYTNHNNNLVSNLYRASAGATTSSGISPATITAPTINPINASYAPQCVLY